MTAPSAPSAIHQHPLRIVLEEYRALLNVFSKVDPLRPQCSYNHTIEPLDESSPLPVGPSYSTSPNEALALKAEINFLLSKGFIRSAAAPIGAPEEEKGTLRMCIEYRQFNPQTRKNKYSLPPIHFLLE